jgi:hypothetical protein
VLARKSVIDRMEIKIVILFRPSYSIFSTFLKTNGSGKYGLTILNIKPKPTEENIAKKIKNFVNIFELTLYLLSIKRHPK